MDPGLLGRPADSATLSNCGEFLKPLATAARRKVGCSTRVMTSGMVKTQRMLTMDDPQPSPTSQGAPDTSFCSEGARHRDRDAVQRLDGSGSEGGEHYPTRTGFGNPPAERA